MSSAPFLPDDITHDILLRLPVHSLGRCSAVCKSWRCLIKTPAFIRNHMHRHVGNQENNNGKSLCQSQALLLLETWKSGHERYALHRGSGELEELAKFVNPVEAYKKTITTRRRDKKDLKWGGQLVGTCNGLVFVHCTGLEFRAFIWNPCLRKLVVLPKPPAPTKGRESTKYVFGYDWRADDYKVLRMAVHWDDGYQTGLRQVQIWSLAKRTWKNLDAADISTHEFEPVGHSSYSLKSRVFVHGALHWVQPLRNGGCSIATFDMSSEKFGKIVIPEDIMEAFRFMHVFPTILRYGSTFAISNGGWDKDPFSDRGYIHIWAMKEYNVAESWTKLVTVSFDEPIYVQHFFTKSGELLLYSSNEDCDRILNPKSEQVQNIKVRRWDMSFIDSFVESLALLDEPNAISF